MIVVTGVEASIVMSLLLVAVVVVVLLLLHIPRILWDSRVQSKKMHHLSLLRKRPSI
jgi:competence protein ComGC